MDYGIQMYSVRDLVKEDLETAIAKMAALGYKKLEFCTFCNHTAEEVVAMLKKYDVEVCSVHSSFDKLVNNYEETVAFHKAIGNKYYIIPIYSLKNQEDLDAFIEKVNPICRKLAADGITLAFHNHRNEFLPNEDGGQIYDQLIYRTELKFQVDMYWAYVGMKNPIALMEKIKDRLISIHMKDGDPNGNGAPLGMGTAPVEEVWHKARELGLPMIVESETQTPDGPTEAKICIEYLKNLDEKYGC
jgi:sugar phosphate isomerase/epimerase